MKTFLALLILALSAITAVLATPRRGLFFDYEDDSASAFEDREGGTIVDRLRGDERFSQFVKALSQERGLRDDLENPKKETTVFAPTNEAFERMKDEWKSRKGEGEISMRDILRYHICPDANIRKEHMHAGTLLRTDLRMKTLGDRRQRIRAFRFHGEIWLNMHGRITHKEIEANNGRIHAIDRVLVPPMDVTEMLYVIPTEFSTFLAGAERTGMTEKLCTEKGITVFAPNNQAWESLGFENLHYLFSCAGQQKGGERRSHDERHEECKGLKDLKKIIAYHIGREVAYSTDMMEKKEMRMKTLEGQELCVKATHRRHGGGEGKRDWYDDYEHRKEEDVRCYNFVLNNGEARVQFTDGLASNGAIQMINNVLIPQDVKLPHDRM